MKKALRLVSGAQNDPDEESSAGTVGASVLVVADTADGDTALQWGLALVRQLVALGSGVTVAVHSRSDEQSHRESLEARLLEAGASHVRLGASLRPLVAFCGEERAGQLSLLLGGAGLRRVDGGVRVVLRAPQPGPAGSRIAEQLERSADVVLGSSREAFAEHYARAILGTG